MDEKELVEACLQNNRNAQRDLYNRFSPLLLGVCLRYTNSQEEGEDILIEGFTKIFSHLNEFRFDCSLFNWMKRIMVNTAISHYRSNCKRQDDLSLEEGHIREVSVESPDAKLNEKDLLAVIQKMPKTYQVIFNLFVVEGFSHKEIGEMLNIQESTSRSQLVRAKNWLKEKLKD